MENLLQRSRFELKYVVSEATATEIRAFARNHLMPDPFARPELNYSYNIYSVYLDSPRLDLMNQTLEGLKNRFKLRVRFYDDSPDHPVFFEIKRRQNDAIIKQRAKVRRDAADRLMRAQNAWPDRPDLANPGDDRGWSALSKFCVLRDKIGGQPRVLVCYNREAWCAPEDDSVRVTFDRQLEAAPYDPANTFALRRNDRWMRLRMSGVVLELKFTDRFPNWMRQMVQTYGLNRCSMAKYVTCSLALTPERLAEALQADASVQIAAARRWEEQRRLERERAVLEDGREGGRGAAPAAGGGSAEAAAPPDAPATAGGVFAGRPGGLIL